MSKQTTKTGSTASRRKFLKSAGLAAGGVAVAGVAAPNVARAEPTVLKMQAAWGGGIFLENAKSYVDRVHAMADDPAHLMIILSNRTADRQRTPTPLRTQIHARPARPSASAATPGSTGP